MTILFFMKPRFYDPGGLNRGFLATEELKKKKKEETPEPPKEEPIEIDEPFSEQTLAKIDEVNSLTERLLYIERELNNLEIESEIMEKIKIQEQVLLDRRKEIKRLVKELREEEEMVIMMLLED